VAKAWRPHGRSGCGGFEQHGALAASGCGGCGVVEQHGAKAASGRGAAPATESDGRRLRDERGHPAPRPFPCMTPDEEVLAWSRMREAACRQLGYPHPDARHGLDFCKVRSHPMF